MSKKKEMCLCGFPQSSPIPHEHDQTEREKAIIKHFRDCHKGLLEACKALIKNEPYGITPYFDEALRITEAAIAAAENEG